MNHAAELGPQTPGQRRYDGALRRRLRLATMAGSARAIGIQVVWLVIIVAGAAIPLTDAVLPGWDWISPTLGFIIVVAAGLERIFRRTTDAAVSLDELRRSLARERRGLLTGIGPYEASEADYVLFIERAEALIAEYDAQMVAYARRVVGQDQSSSDTSS
ncbi:MAG: hypothetical protein ACK5MT_10735 [Actinomycetales bacterium]